MTSYLNLLEETADTIQHFFESVLDENNLVAAQKDFKHTEGGKYEEYLQKLLDLDPTKDSHNPSYIRILTKWFLSDPTDTRFEDIKKYFSYYLEYKDFNIKRIDDKGKSIGQKLFAGIDINTIRNFKFFVEIVEKKIEEYENFTDKETEISGNTVTVFGKKIDKSDITYPTKEEDLATARIIVARADTMSKSIRYGGGFCDWCTARPSSNYFYSYKYSSDRHEGISDEQTMYYVYFLDKENTNDPTRIIHFGITKDGRISYTDLRNDHDLERETLRTKDGLKWLVNKIPELNDAVKSGAFKFVEPPAGEKEIVTRYNNIEPTEFAKFNYQQKALYIQSGERNITVEIWNLMDSNLKNYVVNEYPKDGYKLNENLLAAIQNSSYFRRYFNRLADYINSIVGYNDNEDESNDIEKFYSLILHSDSKAFLLAIIKHAFKFNVESYYTNYIKTAVIKLNNEKEVWDIINSNINASTTNNDIDSLFGSIDKISDILGSNYIKPIILNVITKFNTFEDSNKIKLCNKIILNFDGDELYNFISNLLSQLPKNLIMELDSSTLFRRISTIDARKIAKLFVYFFTIDPANTLYLFNFLSDKYKFILANYILKVFKNKKIPVNFSLYNIIGKYINENESVNLLKNIINDIPLNSYYVSEDIIDRIFSSRDDIINRNQNILINELVNHVVNRYSTLLYNSSYFNILYYLCKKLQNKNQLKEFEKVYNVILNYNWNINELKENAGVFFVDGMVNLFGSVKSNKFKYEFLKKIFKFLSNIKSKPNLNNTEDVLTIVENVTLFINAIVINKYININICKAVAYNYINLITDIQNQFSDKPLPFQLPFTNYEVLNTDEVKNIRSKIFNNIKNKFELIKSDKTKVDEFINSIDDRLRNFINYTPESVNKKPNRAFVTEINNIKNTVNFDEDNSNFIKELANLFITALTGNIDENIDIFKRINKFVSSYSNYLDNNEYYLIINNLINNYCSLQGNISAVNFYYVLSSLRSSDIVNKIFNMLYSKIIYFEDEGILDDKLTYILALDTLNTSNRKIIFDNILNIVKRDKVPSYNIIYRGTRAISDQNFVKYIVNQVITNELYYIEFAYVKYLCQSDTLSIFTPVQIKEILNKFDFNKIKFLSLNILDLRNFINFSDDNIIHQTNFINNYINYIFDTVKDIDTIVKVFAFRLSEFYNNDNISKLKLIINIYNKIFDKIKNSISLIYTISSKILSSLSSDDFYGLAEREFINFVKNILFNYIVKFPQDVQNNFLNISYLRKMSFLRNDKSIFNTNLKFNINFFIKTYTADTYIPIKELINLFNTSNRPLFVKSEVTLDELTKLWRVITKHYAIVDLPELRKLFYKKYEATVSDAFIFQSPQLIENLIKIQELFSVNEMLDIFTDYMKQKAATITNKELEIIIKYIRTYSNSNLRSYLQLAAKYLGKQKMDRFLKNLQLSRVPLSEYKTYFMLHETVSEITPEMIKHVLDIEKAAYPPHMRMLNNNYVERDDMGNIIIPPIEDIANYLECDVNNIILYVGADWFIMGSNRPDKVEIADWASIRGMSLPAIKKFLNLSREFGNKPIEANCRKETSYKFLKKAEQKGYIEILQDEVNYWGGVEMHEVLIKVLRFPNDNLSEFLDI